MTRQPSRSASSGWTSPNIILAVLSLIASGGWAWVGMTREDTQQIEQRLRAVERDIAGLNRDVRWLERRERDEGERQR